MGNKQYLNTSFQEFSSMILKIKDKLNIYRNTTLVGEGKYIMINGHHYGHVILEIQLKDFKYGFYTELEILIEENQIFSEFHPSIVKALNDFNIVYHAIQNHSYISVIKVIGGSMHDVDSRGVSYELATYLAIEDAFSPNEEMNA